MKRTGYLIERIAETDNLYDAFYKACKGKQCKKEVMRYREHLDDNLSLLRQQILTGEVSVGRYHYFTIFDPKERVICAADFEERVLHHAIVNVCLPYFDRTLIDTTYATRKGKGVYAALDKAISGFSRYRFSLKLDFRKYYDSIDHTVLKAILRRKFKDGILLMIFDRIIDSYSTEAYKGLPIGNLTSQYFANIYLSSLDHYVKECLRAPLYIRYMDDMMIAGNDKEALHNIYRLLNVYATDELHLTLKPPIFSPTKRGQVFLGYKVKPYRCELSGRSKRRFRSKLMEYDKKLSEGIWTEQTYQEHMLPLLAFVQHAQSKDFRTACMDISKTGDCRRVGRTE